MLPFFPLREKFPSTSVIAPIVVPLTMTFTPVKGSLFTSVTVPVIVTSCA
ncbi:hypothetical protein SDC9_167074 [bioreactor metagenome]|uniref:Uncharacterized protein n=1 Tax=bioreactor metagenome TaxID=1076179 RepID=A0A645G199_9ZZZZ